MEIQDTGIPGCHLLQGRVLGDQRGTFFKVFHEPEFAALGLRTDWQEEYFSVSTRGVLRGMHFQVPPADHTKMVFCLTGAVLDVVLDLRLGSPVYGKPFAFELDARNGNGLYIPEGCAHGFVAVTETAGMYYKVTSIHSPEHDAGIHYQSIGFDWPVENPAISARDEHHPSLDEFKTPFVFGTTKDA